MVAPLDPPVLVILSYLSKLSLPISPRSVHRYIRSAAMPRQTYDYGTIAPIIVIILLFQMPRNLIVHFLIILL